MKMRAAFLAAAMAMPSTAVHAASYTYMTGSSNPWNLSGTGSQDAAMNTAFGAGNWTKVNGFTTSVFASPQNFIYIDGGDGISTEFNSFISANLSAITNYVLGGGSVMINAGRWDRPNLDTGFGSSLVAGYSSTGTLTAAGLAAGLDGAGAGSSWTGSYFSHDVALGVSTCYVTGEAGCTFGKVRDGYYLGGQTAPTFQSAGGNQLLANQLLLAAADTTAAVPEPATWLMMIAGIGFIGAAMRRRTTKVSYRFA